MAIPITISTRGAATGACFYNEDIYAVNGLDCIIDNISANCCSEVVRPYDFISSAEEYIIAIPGNCANKLYILNSQLKEIDSLCFTTNYGYLLAAYKTCRNKLLLTFEKYIALADYCGNIVNYMIKSECDSVRFISAIPLCNGIIFAYHNGITENILYKSCTGEMQNCILPQNIGINSFTQGRDGTVYGLIKKGYPYRFLYPIFIDGTLNCQFGCGLGTNICNY